MRKSKAIIILIISLIFIGCVTLETYIRNEESYPQIIPIENKAKKLILNEYSLHYSYSSNSLTNELFPTETKSMRFVFYQNKIRLYIVEIITSTKRIQFNENSYMGFNPEMYIRIIDNTGTRNEFKINLDREQLYVMFNDDVVGEIYFNYYRSRNKNDLKDESLSFTGFRIYPESV